MTFVVRPLVRFLGRDVCMRLQRSDGIVVKHGVVTTRASESKKLRQ